jgi:hypothetical protein
VGEAKNKHLSPTRSSANLIAILIPRAIEALVGAKLAALLAAKSGDEQMFGAE